MGRYSFKLQAKLHTGALLYQLIKPKSIISHIRENILKIEVVLTHSYFYIKEVWQQIFVIKCNLFAINY